MAQTRLSVIYIPFHPTKNKRKSNLSVSLAPGMFFRECVSVCCASIPFTRPAKCVRESGGCDDTECRATSIINYFVLSLVSSEIQLTTTNNRRKPNERMHDTFTIQFTLTLTLDARKCTTEYERLSLCFFFYVVFFLFALFF